MKLFKEIIRYILVTILAIAILALVLVNILSSTILSDTYVLSKMKEENYFSEICEYVISKSSNYLPQSGLEEEVLDGVITEEKIEEDTGIIIDNIYNGTEKEIDTEEIAEKLNENIISYLGEDVVASEQDSIDKLIDEICDQYEDVLTHTKYESTINNYYNQIVKYINVGKKLLLVTIGICVFLIIVLSLKRIYRLLAKFGVTFFIDGFILIATNSYVTSNVNVNTITIFNEAMSVVIRNIINDVLSKIMTYGVIFFVLGCIFIIVYGIIKSYRKAKREQDKYTPEY